MTALSQNDGPTARRTSAPAAGALPRLIARVATWRDGVQALAGWRRRGATFAAGALSVLALAPFFLWPILFVTLPVLVWLVDTPGASPSRLLHPSRADVVRAAGAGWWFGFGYFLLGLFWIGEAFLVEAETFAWLLPFAVTLLPAGLALFYGAAAAVARLMWTADASRVLALAATLAGAEWLRGHILSGFPWNVLGYALTSPLALMQSAAVFGIYGLSVLAVIVFALPLVVLADAHDDAGRRGRAWHPRWALLSPAVLAGLFAYGAIVLARTPPDAVPGVKVRMVQPSVPQRDKWRRDKQREIFDKHLALSRSGSGGLSGITLLIWPEAAMPFLPLDTPEALEAIGALLPEGTTLLSGALRVERPSAAGAPADGSIPASSVGLEAFNSIIAFGAGGRPAAIYDKVHLVPFGEYLPLQPLLEAIGLRQLTRMRGGFTAGPQPRPLMRLPGLPPIAPLVCYEALFPGEVWQGETRPGLIVNLTNDGWFGNTTGPRQHLQQARVRAVEEGLPLVRVANNGISAVVDPMGRIVTSIGMNVSATADSSLPRALPAPLLARWTWVIFFALMMGCIFFVSFCRRHAKQQLRVKQLNVRE